MLSSGWKKPGALTMLCKTKLRVLNWKNISEKFNELTKIQGFPKRIPEI